MAIDLSQYANSDPHLSMGERTLSVFAGLALTSMAAQPRPNVFISMLALATGSYLAYRGATGYCVVKASLNGTDAETRPIAMRRTPRPTNRGEDLISVHGRR